MPTESHSDEIFMARCVQLALLGEEFTAPNPMVGAVILHDGKIIGEGWHQEIGEPHAEVNAVNSVPPEYLPLLKDSTIYVSLEPCNHHGRTPPCTDLILKHGFKRVVIGSMDSNPLVGGQGIKRLKANGVEVSTGVLEESCRSLNRKFFTAHELKRPFVTLKWAECKRGHVAQKNGTPVKISNAQTQSFSHRLRANHMGILVGANTVLNDHPQLDNRLWRGKSPQGIILDRQGILNQHSQLIEDSWWRITASPLSFRANDFMLNNTSVSDILDFLFEKGIQSVLIEGGPSIHQQFIDAKLWDECIVYHGDVEIESGLAAAKLSCDPTETFSLGNDLILAYKNPLN